MPATKKASKPTANGSKSVERRPASKRVTKKDFPVVGVGASAGGLDAFGKLLSNMPTDTGMAFVLIQHLDPSHASNMVELLKRYTRMPVHEATDSVKLQPDHVYMIPPNRNMTVTGRTLTLLEQIARPAITHSIDLFFRSLATDLKEKAICIILSGTGADGSLGAKAVKAELGMVMVQDPETAGYDGMPRAAIAAGVADVVLPPEAMPGHLVEYVRKSYGQRAVRRQVVEKGSAGLDAVLALIRARTKHDFSGYKPTTINRRIERRMGINQIDSIDQYLKYVREHLAEADALVKDFLINVTSFFRDPEAFAVLKTDLKILLEARTEGSEVRAWIPGCSTGEEAYSVAMTIEEVLLELDKGCPLQLFGTDLDPDAIVAARTGIYHASIATDVGEERLKRFFARKDDHLQIKRELREKLVFAVQDIITDPPFTRMDMISARNLLIYFDADLQRRLIPMFHYALNPGGLLFLGSAETVGEFAELFSPLDRKWKVYQAVGKTRRALQAFPGYPYWREPTAAEVRPETAYPPVKPAAPARTHEETLLEALPASVLLDSNFMVVFAHGNLRKYLGVPEGRPNMRILDMVHPEIRGRLASGLHEASKQQREVVLEGGLVGINGDSQPVRIVIRPVGQERPGEPAGRLIVTFQSMPKAKPRRLKAGGSQESRIAGLEQELQFTKETLRSTIEELETANEELRSANEEYQSTNEELQSTNEELETSREELQSLNEELSTVNNEYQAKIDELATVNDDMKNLLNSTGIATIYLDNDLKIKRFTPAATNIFNLIASDVDRPIGHITSQIGSDTLPERAKQVLDTLVPHQEEIRTRDGKWYNMRILPYRTTDNSIAGVVVTFIDISERALAKIALALAQGVINTLREPVVVLNADLDVLSANRSFYDYFKLTPKETEGKCVFQLSRGPWNIPELKKLLEEALQGSDGVSGRFLEADFPLVGPRKVSVSARLVQFPSGPGPQLLLVIEDATGGRDTIP